MAIATRDLSEIYKPIRADLELFNTLIRQELKSSDPFIQSINDHLLLISGKHLRPALSILSARMAGNTTDIPVRLAIAIELLHTATLIHDDIIDGSAFRRNQASINAKWGTEVSIISGDYLYAKAFSILAAMNDPNIFKMFAACAMAMCEGEMKQVETRKSLDLSEVAYTEIIHKKTASLFQAACAGGAYVAGQPHDAVYRLGEYGKNFGIAFQIADDCLDIIGQEESLGKKAGLDFDKSDPTLPLIYLYQTGNREELDGLMNGATPQAREENFAKLKQILISTGILEKCVERARDYAARAVAGLEGMPDSVYRKSLSDLVDFTVQRI